MDTKTFLNEHLELWESIVKSAQTTPIDKKLLQSLLDNLGYEIKSLKGGLVSGGYSSTKDMSELFFKDISNTDSFLNFLYNDEVSFSGERLVVGGPNKGDPAKVKISNEDLVANYVAYPSNEKISFYVHKKYVTSFIDYISTLSGIKNNKILLTAIDKIKAEIYQLPGIVKPADTKPEEESKLLPTDLLDWWSSATVNLSKPDIDFSATAPRTGVVVALRKVDLDSVDNINAWINKVKPVIEAPGKMINSDDEGFNICSVFQGLYRRAIKRNTVNNPKAAFYIKQITTLAPQFNGTDGKSCKISNTGMTVETQEPTPSVAGYNSSLDGSRAPVGTPANIEYNKRLTSLLNSLPYINDTEFNIPVCLRFIEGFKNLVGEGSWTRLIDETQVNLNTIENIVGSPVVIMVENTGYMFGTNSRIVPQFGTLMRSLLQVLSNIHTILDTLRGMMTQAGQSTSKLTSCINYSNRFTDQVKWWSSRYSPRIS